MSSRDVAKSGNIRIVRRGGRFGLKWPPDKLPANPPMTFSSVYLALSILNLVFVLSALIKARRLSYLVMFYFAVSWLTGELAFVFLSLQIAFTLLFALGGGLASGAGQLGLGLFALSWLGLLYLHCKSMDTATVLEAALQEGLGEDYRSEIPPSRQQVLRAGIDSAEWLRPFSMKRPGVSLHRNLSYAGDGEDFGERNLLDVYQPQTPREGGFPILLQVHGGAWVIGNKEQQALPLMYHLAQRGWLCVSCNYRLSPKHTFPAHIIDVKRAIAWIREHAAEYGGDPSFLAITGGSAGGHLSALAALTPNKPDWQPGFEDADTSISAAVPFYGVYDFLDRDQVRGKMSMESTLEKYVFQNNREQGYEARDDGSPLSHAGDGAPPTFVVQGAHDSLVWVEEARVFVERLRSESGSAVVYGELPFAQHAFDVFHSVRTDHTVNAVTEFLEWCHAHRAT